MHASENILFSGGAPGINCITVHSPKRDPHRHHYRSDQNRREIRARRLVAFVDDRENEQDEKGGAKRLVEQAGGR
jgi:hypothetical protein